MKKENSFRRKAAALSMLAALMMIVAAPSAHAANGNGFSREKGVIARVGAGAPANFNLGVGYRFNPHFALTMEAYSYSGLTAITGAIDARYYLLKNAITPFVSAKIGYGALGMTAECMKYKDVMSSMTTGLSWRRFDLGAGIIHDPFHKLEYTANLSWAYCFVIK